VYLGGAAKAIAQNPISAAARGACITIHYSRRAADRIAVAAAIAYFQTMELLTPSEIVRLSPSERLALIQQLWDSLNDDTFQ